MSKGEVKAQGAFDYGSLDPETRETLRLETEGIREVARATALGIVEIGERLIRVKERLGHGRFGAWLRAEFDWSDQTARRFMWVAERFGQNQQIVDFAPSALYALSAPSVPQAARDDATSQASNGKPVTHADARRIIAARKPERPKPPPEPPPEPDPTPEPWTCPECGEANEGHQAMCRCYADRPASPGRDRRSAPAPAPAPERNGHTRVNGKPVPDPPDIAAARASGRIAAEAVVEIDEPEPEPVPEPAVETPPESDDGDDAAFLASLPQRSRLAGRQLATFDEQALAYRALESARRGYAHHAARVIKSVRRRGPFTWRVQSFLKIEHPQRWNVCPPLDKGGCEGTGEVPGLGECPMCRGVGFLIR